jgi:hypothetical protein
VANIEIPVLLFFRPDRGHGTVRGFALLPTDARQDVLGPVPALRVAIAILVEGIDAQTGAALANDQGDGALAGGLTVNPTGPLQSKNIRSEQYH